METTSTWALGGGEDLDRTGEGCQRRADGSKWKWGKRGPLSAHGLGEDTTRAEGKKKGGRGKESSATSR